MVLLQSGWQWEVLLRHATMIAFIASRSEITYVSPDIISEINDKDNLRLRSN